MGANHTGEIDHLTNIALPDVAIITSIGSAHLEGFGSIENIAKAKGEIFNGLNKTGTAIIKADDRLFEYFKVITTEYNVLILILNIKSDNTCKCESSTKGSNLTITKHKGNCEINLKLLGSHNVMNALAAIAASVAINITLEKIKVGLEKLEHVDGRLQIKLGINNSRVIDDTYNANPTSL